MHTGLPTHVNAREQKVPKFFFHREMAFVQHRHATRPSEYGIFPELLANLGELLVDFLGWTFHIGPVEAHSRGAILKPMRAVKCRQIDG